MLELMVAQLHGYLRTDLRYGNNFLPSPFMIEFTGSPDSGKTTCIKELDKFLHRHDFRVLMPQEGAEVIRHIPRTTPEYNLRTGLYALEMVIDYAYGHAYDVVIFDRSIFDPYAWMMYWEGKELLTKEERELIQKFFLMRFWVDRIIASFIFVCEPEEAVRRGQRIALSEKLGETSNPEAVRKLIDRYRKMYEELAPTYPQVKLVDTTTMTEGDMVTHIAGITMETLLTKARERRGVS
jgi:thymidylate kinase